MPLYTFVMSYKGRTAVYQHRKSNFKGWLSQVIAAGFPDLAKDKAFTTIRLGEPEAIPNVAHVWRFSVKLAEGELMVHVVETKN
ncbi:hypothetical protein [Microvirga flavescens]|uniref:hypothetical protein n=1 Tax=Microvirga flavescens TaxID=2249811 RepID=UPI000DD7E96D|nr:hypothetical protein [Microvirga flavescens]